MAHWDSFLHYRSGSTIVDYTVAASAFNNAEINAVKSGIFGDLRDTYPIIFDSKTILHIEKNIYIYRRIY